MLPGVLWVTFAFAGTLELNRSMAAETEGGRLDGLLLGALPGQQPGTGHYREDIILQNVSQRPL